MSSENSDDTYVFYYYNPSLVGAIIYVICFAILVILQTYQIIISIIRVSRSKKSRSSSGSDHGGHKFARMLIPFYLGLLCEVIGHIARALGHEDNANRNKYIIQSILMLIAPPLFSATLYMVLGRTISYVLHNEQCLLVPSKYLTKICVGGDVLSLLMQAGGAGILVKGGDSYKTGQNVILGGLGVQILFFGFFVVIETTYYIKLRKSRSSITQKLRNYPSRYQNWNLILITLFLSSIFILIRSIFRIAEFTEARGGTIAKHEWFLYIFDSLMMLLCSFLFVSQDTSNYIIKSIPVVNEDSGFAHENNDEYKPDDYDMQDNFKN